MIDKQLLSRAHRELLDVLNSINQDKIHHDGDDFHELLNDIEKTLAQPEQEPVAWIEKDMQCDDFDPDSVTCEKPTIVADGWEWVPLYTHLPQRTEPLIGCVNHDCALCKDKNT